MGLLADWTLAEERISELEGISVETSKTKPKERK